MLKLSKPNSNVYTRYWKEEATNKHDCTKYKHYIPMCHNEFGDGTEYGLLGVMDRHLREIFNGSVRRVACRTLSRLTR